MNFCLIGTGVGASINAKAAKGMKNLRILAVSGADEKHTSSFARKYGIPRYYTDSKVMLEKEEPEGVVIASTPMKHWRDISLCKNYCKTIVVEKPIVTDVNLIPQIKALVANEDISLSVTYQHRYDETYQKLKKILTEIKDDIYHINLSVSDYRGENYYSGHGEWRKSRVDSGGGVMIQHGVHWINFLFSLFDYDYKLENSRCFYQGGVETEGAVFAEFTLAGRISCALFSSRMSPEIRNGIEIYAKKGSYFISENSISFFEPKKENKFRLKIKEFIDKVPFGVNLQYHLKKGSHRDFLNEVVEKNSNGKKESIFLNDALNDVSLINKIYSSFRFVPNNETKDSKIISL
jgi:predicted dehydrogenase